jgi:hypothetical protein
VQAALKKCSKSTLNAVAKEIYQLLTMDVFRPVHFKKISFKRKKKLVRSFMFMKEKYFPDGTFDKMKTRLVAGGNDQEKELMGNVSSPTVSLAALLATLAIAKREKRKAVSADIPGAYLNADMEESDVFMILVKLTSALMIEIDKSYRAYLQPDGTIIVKLKKALYGCVESAKLWYESLAKSLESFGMNPNKRDKCVFNKYFNDEGVQLTVAVYVDGG